MMETGLIQGAAIGFILGYFLFFLYSRTPSKIPNSSKCKCKLVMVVRTEILSNRYDIAEYCSKAALECYKKAKVKCPDVLLSWERNSQPKIALKMEGRKEILKLHEKAICLGLVTSVGVMKESFFKSDYAVIGIGPGPEDLINEVTGHLKLL